MTSEEMTGSVLLPHPKGKVISVGPAVVENTANALDTSVIKRHTESKGQTVADTVSYLHILKEGYLNPTEANTFSFAKEERQIENTSKGDFWDGNKHLSGSAEYIHRNCDILDKNCKCNLPHEQLCKSCDSLAGKDICVEPVVPALFERGLFSEFNLEMDIRSVEMQSLRCHSAVNECSTGGLDVTAALHLSYASERSLPKTLCVLHNSFILGNYLEGENTGKGPSDNSVVCTCKCLELSSSFVNENEQMLNECETLKDKHLNLVQTSGEAKILSCSGSSVSGENVTGRVSLKPFLNHVEDCSNSCEEDIENDFSRNKKERSTLLIRRFCKNYKEVKKSVYTGTRAIVRTLPSGHIGIAAWNYVDQKNKIHILNHCWIITEYLRVGQGSLTNPNTRHYPVRSLWNQIHTHIECWQISSPPRFCRCATWALQMTPQLIMNK